MTDETTQGTDLGYSAEDVRFLEFTRLAKDNMTASLVDHKISELEKEFTAILGVGANVSKTIYGLLVLQVAAIHTSIAAPAETVALLHRLADEIENNADYARVGHVAGAPVESSFYDALLAVRYGVQRFHETQQAQHQAQLADVLARMGVEQPKPPAETVQ